MRLQFKDQPYQTAAVEAVVECFAGQPRHEGTRYRVDPGRAAQPRFEEAGFRNADLALSEAQILANVKAVQRRQGLPESQRLDDYFDATRQNRDQTPRRMRGTYDPGAKVNLDIEMETGTGKTYCYIKSIFELNQRYGWSKFVLMVPSIAIREGVRKAFDMTQAHFAQAYGGKKARAFVYSSKALDQIESFSSDAGINVMIINIQAFNATGRDNRRIYEELDDFQSRRPIDVIQKNRPILILDEPQKMGGQATLEALPKFDPLFILRYSATHAVNHAKVHRLDALDAYNQKLVKKIAVRGIQTRGLAGTQPYLYLQRVEISRADPVAWIEMDIKQASGEIKRRLTKITKADNLYDKSRQLAAYRDRFAVAQISAQGGEDRVEFINGLTLKGGEAFGDVQESDLRRIQITEAVAAHLDAEEARFAQGIKVLTLFFIDEVAKYRDYSLEDGRGDYARLFEEVYEAAVAERLETLPLENKAYREFLEDQIAADTHQGYFSIDKRTQNFVNPTANRRGENAGQSDDVDAYDLILKDKESLLSFPTPADDAETRKRKNVRFLFSHSALREGWDNPNVFVICMLKNSDNTISRRQEVGRGLRLCVDQRGERVDHPATVHDTNVLTVVANESYEAFVKGLQSEISEGLSARPRQASREFFQGKQIETAAGPTVLSEAQASQIEFYLIQNGYVTFDREIAPAYHEAKDGGTLADLPPGLAPIKDEVFRLIDSLFSADTLAKQVEDSRRRKNMLPNDNLHKQEFLALWNRINKRVVYRVKFDSDELIEKCVAALNHLRVTRLQYVVREGAQVDQISERDLQHGTGFREEQAHSEFVTAARSKVAYDLLGTLAERTELTRKTIAAILTQIEASVFGQFAQNPEHFMAEAARLINEQKGAQVIKQLTYDEAEGEYDIDIFTQAQAGEDVSRAVEGLKKHVYDYCLTDSKIEADFVKQLDTREEVVVYAKLPRGFQIPTPVGDYNPDWAISFRQDGGIRHIYFVAETKGSLSSLQLRGIEGHKITCAGKFFDRLEDKGVKYDVVDSYADLFRKLVGNDLQRPSS